MSKKKEKENGKKKVKQNIEKWKVWDDVYFQKDHVLRFVVQVVQQKW